MLIGLDVGGTHTDAALLGQGDGSLLASAKAPTRPGDVLPGILEALQMVLRGYDPRSIRRVCVSSTLGLNALLTGRNDPAGMLVVPGPGIDPRVFWGADPLFQVLPGAQDHRGNIIASPPREDIWKALRHIAAQKTAALGVVCKFSPKNPELEMEIGRMAREELGPDIPIILGSSVSGSLNFPRRMHTVWCNASLAGISRAFILSLEQAGRDMGLICPLVVLKADAGVFPAGRAAVDPASSMGSGPAASLLGTWAFSGARQNQTGDTLMIDMGGTSTDLALMARGFPLLSPEGLTVRGRLTLVRSLWTRSIALGGDSSLRIGDRGEALIGPDRSGPPLALEDKPGDLPGTRPPTLTDALNVLGLAQIGDSSKSFAALARLAGQAEPCLPASAEEKPGPASDSEKARALARRFVDQTLQQIREEADVLLQSVNSQPVYTIRELLISDPVEPEKAIFIGGPAAALGSEAEKALGLPVLVPRESAFANAVGAALARPTRTADLYADTLLGNMSIPDFGLEKKIGKGYTLEQAKEDLLAAFAETEKAERFEDESADLVREASGQGALDREASGPEEKDLSRLQIVSAESFAMLDDQGRRGRTIRLRAQQPAGLLSHSGLIPQPTDDGGRDAL